MLASLRVCAGGNCTAEIPAATSSLQSPHSWPPVASKPTFTCPDRCWSFEISAIWPSAVFGCRNRSWPGRKNPSSQSRDTSIPGMVNSATMSLSLSYVSRSQNGPPSTVRDGEERRDQPARQRGHATRCLALYPTHHRSWPGSMMGHL